jgi:hypothetical protein
LYIGVIKLVIALTAENKNTNKKRKEADKKASFAKINWI